MSMLNAVKKDLFANAGVGIVDIRIINHIPERNNYWSETVNITVAPNKGIYESAKLQELMLQLTPKVECTDKDSFYESEGYLSFGKLYFDEDIGIEKKYVRREIVITDEDLLKKNFEGFVDGKCVVEKNDNNIPLQRRTWVRLYPNVQVALVAVHTGKFMCSIDKAKLSKYKGRLARMLTRLGFKP